MDGRRQSFTDLTAKRSTSNVQITQLLGLAAIETHLILDTTTAVRKDMPDFLKVK